MANLEVSIFTTEGKPTVSSLQLAEHFGIRHHHVLRDIKTILRKAPEIFTQTNFGFSEYIDATGRTLPVYNLTRDAFTLLAMGYNSVRAIAWKLKYIEAFNALEQAALSNAREAALAEGISQGARLMAAMTPERLALARKAAKYRSRGFNNTEIGKLMGMSRGTVRQLFVSLNRLGLGV